MNFISSQWQEMTYNDRDEMTVTRWNQQTHRIVHPRSTDHDIRKQCEPFASDNGQDEVDMVEARPIIVDLAHEDCR